MQKLYVLGHPVTHSKSPVMYNAVYRELGLDWDYGFADIESSEDARTFIEARDYLSINITTPHKPVAFQAASVVTSSAALAQGANVLVSKNGALIADNTDGLGCVSYLKRRGVVFKGADVVVCGTGPTARAIMHACALAGASRVVLMGRDEARTKAAVADYRCRLEQLAQGDSAVIAAIDPRYAQASLGDIVDSCQMLGCSYERGADLIAGVGVIIDATRLGMNPGDPAPFDTSLVSAGQAVFDVVYAHGETALIGAARKAGAAVFDGEGMLVAQAVATVHDIKCALDLPIDFDSIDLFKVMAESAGFNCAQCV